MMGTTHAMGAAAVWLAGCAVLGPPAPTVIAAGAGLAVAGGLAPDIDHRNAGAAKVARMAGLALVGAAGFAALTATSHHDWRLWAIIGAVVGLVPGCGVAAAGVLVVVVAVVGGAGGVARVGVASGAGRADQRGAAVGVGAGPPWPPVRVAA